MSEPGPPPKISVRQVVRLFHKVHRPVWTARQFADYCAVSRTTAQKRLRDAVDKDELSTIDVGNATAYYLPGKEMPPPELMEL